MKQEINIAEKIETAQIKLGRQEMTEALQKWMSDNYQFDLTKAVYGVSGNTLNEVTIDVRKRLESTDKVVKTLQTNGAKTLIKKTASIQAIRPTISTKVPPHSKKHEKVNKGLYGALREFFESERKNGVKTLNFEELYELVKVEYPHLEPSRLSLYLFDRRQFPDIDYKRVEGTVTLLDKKRKK